MSPLRFQVPPIPPSDATLTDQLGRVTRLTRFKDQVTAMYFGYTYCPDVCPTTLSRLAAARGALGALRARLRVVFVSVDPARDTPSRLRDYLANFDPSFVGLTGTQKQIAAIARHYGARYAAEKPEAGDAYTVAHTSYVYLLDRRGTVRYLFPDDVPLDVLIRGVKALLPS